MSLAERKDFGRFNLDSEGVIIAFNTPSVSIYNSTSPSQVVRHLNHSALPAELGRIAAYQTNVTDAKKLSRTPLKLVDCELVLSPDEISNSPRSF